MSPLVLYMVKTAVSTGLFTLLYYLFLRKETFHFLNRIYLLAALILSLVLPALKFRIIIPEVASLNTTILDAVNVYISQPSAEKGLPVINPDAFIEILFYSGAAFIALLTLKRLLEILTLIRNHKLIRIQESKIIEVPENYPSFSFFNYIFISLDKQKQAFSKQIIRHEKAHSVQLHSLDIIFLQIVKIFQWFNPFIYLLEKQLKEIHEYLADMAATEQEGLTDGYELLLLNQAFGLKPGILNFFNTSLIKKRIIMMTKQKSPSYRKIKYISVLPLMAIILVFFNCSDDASVTNIPELKDAKEVAPPPPDVISTESEFVFVENDAKFQGGTLTDFMTWVGKNIEYPEGAISDQVFGRVTIQFAVTSTGKVTDVAVIRGVDERLDNEAKRVILSSPDWEPATQGGRPVKQLFTIPVVFALTEEITEP